MLEFVQSHPQINPSDKEDLSPSGISRLIHREYYILRDALLHLLGHNQLVEAVVLMKPHSVCRLA